MRTSSRTGIGGGEESGPAEVGAGTGEGLRLGGVLVAPREFQHAGRGQRGAAREAVSHGVDGGGCGRAARALADDVTFEGPLATASGVAECVAGLVEMGKMIPGERVEVRRRAADRDLVAVGRERITAIRTVFVARETGGR
ncbi:nuclear transport factor 2 family protein [Streptomyces koyangensis]